MIPAFQKVFIELDERVHLQITVKYSEMYRALFSVL